MASKENIVLTGYYNKKNTGDDLFLNMAVKLFNSNKNYSIKIIPIDIIQKYISTIAEKNDSIILFGGEVLNNYFLEPLMKIKELNQKIKLFAMGVSIGQDIDEIKYMLLSFQYIICRNSNDYNLLKNILPILKVEYMQDIVFLHNIKGYKYMTPFNIIGFFLSQPKYYSLDKNGKALYTLNIIHSIKNMINAGYSIYLFSMCYNNIDSECDLILNKYLYKLFNSYEQKKIKIIMNDTFDKDILNIKYAICERFHAHILCLIYNIPFISLANTNKVKYLLNDLNISNLLQNNISIDINILDILTKIDKNNLKQIYKSTYKLVQEFYSKLNNKKIEDLLDNYPKYKINLYVSDKNINNYCNDIYIKYNEQNDKVNYVMMNLFGESKNECLWGIENKIHNNQFTFDDIKWLFNKSICMQPYLMNKLYNLINEHNTTYLINIDYIDQYDKTGVHRSGWRYITDNISNNFSSYDDTIFCDLYIDRTFHWNSEFMKDIIPYKKPWIGFIHHTLWKDESGYNCIELFKNKKFIESLDDCNSIIVLSNYLKNQLINLAKKNNIIIPQINVLYHPTQFVSDDKLWNFNLWDGSVVQIGSWMRNIKAIYDLNYDKKFALVGKEIDGKYISFNKNKPYPIFKNNTYPVKLIKYVENNDYDLILTNFVVFLNLYDASAVNTIIECIVRNTPIFVNKLEAVVEYLGENYPLYYNNLDDVPKMINNKKLIIKTHKYLKNMDKTFLKIDTFINNLNKIILSLPSNV